MSDFDPNAYTSDFDPTAYAGVEEPVQERPGFLKRAARVMGLDSPQRVGETLADDVTAAASLGGLFNPLLGLAGAVGQYFMPDSKTGGGSFTDRYNREMAGLKTRQDEAFQRSPMTTPPAAVAGFATALPAAPAAVHRALSPVSTLATREAPLLARMAAGYSDAALGNAAIQAAQNSYEGGDTYANVFQRALNAPENLIGAAIPAVQEATPAMVATAKNVRDLGRRARVRMFGDSAQVAREKFGNYEKAGEALGELQTTPPPKLKNGQLVEEAPLQVDRPGISTAQRGSELEVIGKQSGKRIGEIVRQAQDKGAKFDYHSMRQEAQELFDNMFKGNPEADRVGSATHSAKAQAQALLDEMDRIHKPEPVLAGKELLSTAAGDKVRVFERAKTPPPERDPKTGRMKKSTKGAPELQKSTVETVGELKLPRRGEGGPRLQDSPEGADPNWNEAPGRDYEGTLRPAPDTGWTVVIDEPTLPETEALKSGLATEANVDAYGKPIPEAAKAASPILTFKDRLSGIIKSHGEKAISAVDPELGQEFLRQKRIKGTVETFKEPTLEAGDVEFQGTSRHREVYPTKHGIFYKAMQTVGKHVNPRLSQAGHWAEGKLSTIPELSGGATLLPPTAAIMSEQRRALRPRTTQDFIADYLRQRSE